MFIKENRLEKKEEKDWEPSDFDFLFIYVCYEEDVGWVCQFTEKMSF